MYLVLPLKQTKKNQSSQLLAFVFQLIVLLNFQVPRIYVTERVRLKYKPVS